MAAEITIADCLKELETGKIVHLGVWTYDRKRGKGGELDTFECQLITGLEKPHAVMGRLLTDAEMLLSGPDDFDDDNALHHSKKPNHYEWYTRNVRIVVNGHPTSIIRKIHPPLIARFDGMKTVP